MRVLTHQVNGSPSPGEHVMALGSCSVQGWHESAVKRKREQSAPSSSSRNGVQRGLTVDVSIDGVGVAVLRAHASVVHRDQAVAILAAKIKTEVSFCDLPTVTSACKAYQVSAPPLNLLRHVAMPLDRYSLAQVTQELVSENKMMSAALHTHVSEPASVRRRLATETLRSRRMRRGRKR